MVGIDSDEKGRFSIAKEKFDSKVKIFVNGGFM